jgi:hypothetical protein
MDSIYSTPFSKATLTGVFVGIITTVVCIFYDVIFRQSTGFLLSDYINVSTLIFCTNLLFLVIGIIYFVFLRIKKGEIFFIVLFLALTAIFAFMADHAQRSPVPQLNAEFHRLLVPIVIIMGLAASIAIPYLFHNKKFEEHVL